VITNATLVSVTSPPVSNGSGGYTAGATTTLGVPCLVDEPSTAQIVAVAGQIAGVNAILYVEKVNLPSGVTPAKGGSLAFKMNKSETTLSRRIAKSVDREKVGGPSHFELWLNQ
jgi:hypothetical protein